MKNNLLLLLLLTPAALFPSEEAPTFPAMTDIAAALTDETPEEDYNLLLETLNTKIQNICQNTSDASAIGEAANVINAFLERDLNDSDLMLLAIMCHSETLIKSSIKALIELREDAPFLESFIYKLYEIQIDMIKFLIKANLIDRAAFSTVTQQDEIHFYGYKLVSKDSVQPFIKRSSFEALCTEFPITTTCTCCPCSSSKTKLRNIADWLKTLQKEFFAEDAEGSTD